MLAEQGGGRRRGGILAAGLIALSCALCLPAGAAGELLAVDSTVDEADALPGAGGCLTAGGNCTLRAAIEESNASSEEVDEVIFDEEAFDGQATSTIAIASSLPVLVSPVRINGKVCATAADVTGPCAGVDGPAAGPALVVDGAEEVEIEGLAITGAQTGIEVEGAGFFRLRASWIGVGLDGDDGGNATGVLVGPGSDFARVGGEGPEAGNVFGYSSGEGLRVHGAAQVKVLGNYFGVEPDGATPAPNGEDIEVTSVGAGGPQALGTAIGTRVGPGAVSSGACDGGCNVISGAVTSGLDLQGDGGAEAPALATTVAGNYVGLDPAGAAAIPNGASGIEVGEAAQTVIGGPKAGDANHVAGGDAGIAAGPAAQDLVVNGNLIGVDASGAQLDSPGQGIVVDSQGLATPALEATISGNRIRMEGGVGIDQKGTGARIAGNEVSGAALGIRVHEANGEYGNLIEGNSLEGAGASGILIENDFNEIVGNRVLGAGGAGIEIQGPAPFGATGNVVGGDEGDDENVVTGSGGDAIAIANPGGTNNEVARNQGTVNAGLFIDLIAASPGAEGPNGGIEPPALTGLTQSGAAGGGAEPGARVRVFRKRTSEAGEIESFLGEAAADSDGSWQVSYGVAVPAGAIVAATQTSEGGGTSELAIATTPAGGAVAAGGAEGGGGSEGGLADRVAPRTKIIRVLRKRSAPGMARFSFDSDELDSSFQCRLDRRPFRACASPKSYRGLKPGRHVFEVRAVDPAGNGDETPAKREFTVAAGDRR